MPLSYSNFQETEFALARGLGIFGARKDRSIMQCEYFPQMQPAPAFASALSLDKPLNSAASMAFGSHK